MNQLLIKHKNEITKKKKKGFTLVELIIVIAIIAVLAAIAIPKFGAIKKDANLRADQANAKIIATAVATAISDGETTSDAITSAKYLKYIDGGKIPPVKSVATGGAFSVNYDDAKGVIIKINDAAETQVYPVS